MITYWSWHNDSLLRCAGELHVQSVSQSESARSFLTLYCAQVSKDPNHPHKYEWPFDIALNLLLLELQAVITHQICACSLLKFAGPSDCGKCLQGSSYFSTVATALIWAFLPESAEGVPAVGSACIWPL